MIRSMLDGDVPACPPFGTSWVDVRDVADLHLRAMTDPAAAGERWLASAGPSLRIVEVAAILRHRLGDRAASPIDDTIADTAESLLAHPTTSFTG